MAGSWVTSQSCAELLSPFSMKGTVIKLGGLLRLLQMSIAVLEG